MRRGGHSCVGTGRKFTLREAGFDSMAKLECFLAETAHDLPRGARGSNTPSIPQSAAINQPKASCRGGLGNVRYCESGVGKVAAQVQSTPRRHRPPGWRVVFPFL